jgi:pseudouridine-5'-monophosphatase
MKKAITHFIFDLDGLLLDTEPFYTQATQEVVREFGKTFDWGLKARMMGRPAMESARFLVEALDLPITPEEYLRRREKTMLRLFPTAEARPGALWITRQAVVRGIPQAVATSSTRSIFHLKTTRHSEWFSIFETIITGDDPEVTRGKPAPDIFLLAAGRMGVPPERCLVFEDSLSGVEAAVAAKMPVIAVPDPNLDHGEFRDADRILRSLEDFCFEDWDLPAPL